MKQSDISNDIKVNIEFVAEQQQYVKIGIPHHIWINKDDTLNTIINQHLKELRDHLKRVYIMKDAKRQSISRKNWNIYKLYNGFDHDQKQKTLLFKLNENTLKMLNGSYVMFENSTM